jgi:hypothetical protein
MVFGDLCMWSTTNNEGYKCPSIVPFASDTSHLHCFKAHGILCALHIFCLGQPPLPCSPFLLCHAIWGFNDLIDPAFVELLAPETAASLAALPLDPMQPLDLAVDGSLASLLAAYSNIQVRCVIFANIGQLTDNDCYSRHSSHLIFRQSSMRSWLEQYMLLYSSAALQEQHSTW